MLNLFNTPPPEIPVKATSECDGRHYWIEEPIKEEIKEEIRNSSSLEAPKASTQLENIE